MQIDPEVLEEVEAALAFATQAHNDKEIWFPNPRGECGCQLCAALARLRKAMEANVLLSERIEIEARWPDFPDRWRFWACHAAENVERSKAHAIESGAVEVRVVRVSREVVGAMEAKDG